MLPASAADVLDVLAGVEAEAAEPGAEEGQQEQAPGPGSAAVLVLHIGHGQVAAGVAVYEDGLAGVPARAGVLLSVH